MRRHVAALLLLLGPAAVARAQSPAAQPEPQGTTAGEATAPEKRVDGGAPPPTKAEAPAQPQPSKPLPVVNKWSATLYGFAEFDAIYDTTESLNDLPGNALIARDGTYASQNGRVTFGARNSRLGFRFSSPVWNGVKGSGLIETDFLGIADL